jgi:hypothetical protein
MESSSEKIDKDGKKKIVLKLEQDNNNGIIKETNELDLSINDKNYIVKNIPNEDLMNILSIPSIETSLEDRLGKLLKKTELDNEVEEKPLKSILKKNNQLHSQLSSLNHIQNKRRISFKLNRNKKSLSKNKLHYKLKKNKNYTRRVKKNNIN